MDKATDLALVMVTVAGAILALVAQKMGRGAPRNGRNTNCSSHCGCIKSSAPSVAAPHPITPAPAGGREKDR